MFKKSRIKIVASIMSILAALWVGTLGIIYASSYFEMLRQNNQMLKTQANMYVLSQTENTVPHNIPKPRPDNNKHGFEHDFSDTPMFQLSTFYTVAFSYDGETLEIKNDRPSVYSDEDLESLAKEITKNEKETGKVNNLVFYQMDKGGYLLVVFMDNTVINESAATLLRYTLIFGGAALMAFFFLSVFLARKIVQPLEESYQKQKQFISDAGHELKTPISVVSANAELLSRDIGDNQWLSNIQYENERMGVLVGQLLELARTENVKPQTEYIDFSRLVAGETLPFESVAFEKGLCLNSNISNDIYVKGNGSQLKQLVSIMLDNAVCHSDSGNTVCLALTQEHGFARFSVINKGDEISKEHQAHLFDRFYRVDEARNGDDKHYGLGLAIAKAIVTSHKGHIEVVCYNGLVEFRAQIPALKLQ